MKLFCVGLNWKTPVSLRERLAFDDAGARGALRHWRSAFARPELVLLSTCNRTELYAVRETAEPIPDLDDMSEFLADARQTPLSEFCEHLYIHEDAGAVEHLFKVASGLDSLVLGEGQILGQVRSAYQLASAEQTAGAVLHPLFQRALAVAKRVRTETSLGKGRLSIASLAVDHVKGVFDTFSDKTVLVIGAGKMAELTLTHLQSLRPKAIVLVNRTTDRARALADKVQGRVEPIERLSNALIEADIVLSSTGSPEPLVHVAQFQQIMKARRQRLMAIVDMAVPRDFDPQIGREENVLLWSLDDLEKSREQTLRQRVAEVDDALRIVESEARSFEESLAIQQSGPMIGRLEREYARIMEQELEWLLPQLEGVPTEKIDKIRQFAHRLKNKYLHPPKLALRQNARQGSAPGLLEAVRKMFGMD